MELEPIIHPKTGELLPAARPAATLVLFRDDPEGGAPKILMMERSASMAFAAGAAVFPGGRVDEADYAFAREVAGELEVDDASARLAALRETLEETGLAFAIEGKLGFERVAAARKALHDGRSFADVCRSYGWTPDLSLLTPWARWRPPNIAPRIYDTRFYIADANRLKKDGWVDNTENTSLFWAGAQEVLDRSAKQELQVIFPTRRNLERLALFNNFEAARAHALEYPVELCLTYMEERDGERYLCIPDGLGYPVLSELASTAMHG